MNILRTAVVRTNERIGGIGLRESAAFPGRETVCSETDVATAAFTYMVGLRDGTGCGVKNINYYKTLSLDIPSPVSVPPIQNAQLVQRPDQYIASTLLQIRGSLNGLSTRIGGIAFAETPQVQSDQYVCGNTPMVSSTPFQLMVNIRDGTACGVPNVHYLKQLSLKVPAR